VTTIVQLDGSNRIVLPRKLRRAAGVPRGQKFKASATPGRIVLEIRPVSRGKVIKPGKLKLWSGQVPSTPLAEAVETMRRLEAPRRRVKLTKAEALTAIRKSKLTFTRTWETMRRETREL